MDDLEKRAMELNLYDLTPFYRSKLFASHGLRIDEENRVITKVFSY